MAITGSAIDTLNFVGDNVLIKKYDEHKAAIIIGKPVGGSHFNNEDGDTDGRVFLANHELIDMVIPDVSDTIYANCFGDLKVGKVCKRRFL